MGLDDFGEKSEILGLVSGRDAGSEASLSFLNILQQLIVNFTLCGGMILATLRVLEAADACFYMRCRLGRPTASWATSWR